MSAAQKAASPFYPGQPVPVELFVGREAEVQRIGRAAGQVVAGKPQAMFITGEYGIGKSSLARYVRVLADQRPGLFGLHVVLGTATTIAELATRTVQTMLESEAGRPNAVQKIRNSLAKYVGQQQLMGIRINFDALRDDGPSLARGYLPFLREALERVADDGYRGMLLILDEINGLAATSAFAHFIKGIVDENALSPKPLPLLLMLCGVDEWLRRMIEHHKPVERIFEIAEINPMSDEESKAFFREAFRNVGLSVSDAAIDFLTYFSGGQPRLMHLVGDAAFWCNEDDTIDERDAITGVIDATEDVGRKFVNQQLYNALRSKHYHSILDKLGRLDFGLGFRRADVAKRLTNAEKDKFDNFLQRMKKLRVLTAGEERGEYVFCDHLTRLYIRMVAEGIRRSRPGSRKS